ncbi:hypothetical protein [Kitasatospora sp. NBC_01300]|uniref:hypothetical protein n=1 Tax=Kitasatospora sp. NBC_01300 TaxID=2903574 RepID=UPI00352C9783|nr:hypothetical protein OG556_27400 [Kitasatospora sp. NBC_01300]
MPFAETPLRDEYAAAVERVARRTLDALRGDGGAAALADPDGAVPRPTLAALRVLGADLFAPQLLAGAAPDGPTAELLAQARQAFPAPNPAPDAATAPVDAALVIAWQDWAAGQVLARTPYGTGAPPPVPPPGPEAVGWQTWSVRMAQLSVLALPGLDGPVHDTARAHTLALARGTVRSMLRRDLPTAARLARWLAWAGAEGRPLRLEVEPVLERIRLAGNGSARTGLELAVAGRLLDRSSRPPADRRSRVR